jgi:hypothetical protein
MDFEDFYFYSWCYSSSFNLRCWSSSSFCLLIFNFSWSLSWSSLIRRWSINAPLAALPITEAVSLGLTLLLTLSSEHSSSYCFASSTSYSSPAFFRLSWIPFWSANFFMRSLCFAEIVSIKLLSLFSFLT